jgi:hypothetical protein
MSAAVHFKLTTTHRELTLDSLKAEPPRRLVPAHRELPLPD